MALLPKITTAIQNGKFIDLLLDQGSIDCGNFVRNERSGSWGHVIATNKGGRITIESHRNDLMDQEKTFAVNYDWCVGDELKDMGKEKRILPTVQPDEEKTINLLKFLINRNEKLEKENEMLKHEQVLWLSIKELIKNS
jgi:hypothetical protein